MRYNDPLYGEWELPECIERLVHTEEMVRMRGITQAVIPNRLMPFGPFPSRFEHGLGVCLLAELVLKKNPHLKDYEVLLPAAALLHDAGNPPFAHLSEHFLTAVTGKDGESFLAEVLDGSETERVLRTYDLPTQDVVQMVRGARKPVAEVLNGSMDIDNLDNVARYARAAHLSIFPYSASFIASSFKFVDDGWHLPYGVYEEARVWQKARAQVYTTIYGITHLRAAMMIYRAVELAYTYGDLTRDFFRFDDEGALAYLARDCNDGTQDLIERALRWEWHEEILSIECTEPGEKLRTLASHWSGRRNLAELITKNLKMRDQAVAVYVGVGRDGRRITIPFLKKDGTRWFDPNDENPIYRVKVFLAPEYTSKREDVIELIKTEI